MVVGGERKFIRDRKTTPRHAPQGTSTGQHGPSQHPFVSSSCPAPPDRPPLQTKTPRIEETGRPIIRS